VNSIDGYALLPENLQRKLEISGTTPVGDLAERRSAADGVLRFLRQGVVEGAEGIGAELNLQPIVEEEFLEGRYIQVGVAALRCSLPKV